MESRLKTRVILWKSLQKCKIIVYKETTISSENLRDYDGAEVIVTLLNYPQRKAKKAPVDWDSFVIPSERGQHVDEYMKEMRENDRL